MPRGVPKEPKPLRTFKRRGPLPKLQTPSAQMDPYNINARLYRQIGLLLDDLEIHHADLELKERIAAMIAIGRVQTIFVNLRKENKNAPGSGSAVRKYANAFKANAAGRRARPPRSAAADDPVGDDFALDDAIADGDAA